MGESKRRKEAVVELKNLINNGPRDDWDVEFGAIYKKITVLPGFEEKLSKALTNVIGEAIQRNWAKQPEYLEKMAARSFETELDKHLYENSFEIGKLIGLGWGSEIEAIGSLATAYQTHPDARDIREMASIMMPAILLGKAAPKDKVLDEFNAWKAAS